MLILALIAFCLLLAVFSRHVRRDLFKPEHSTWKVLVYVGLHSAFDYAVGIPLKGFSALETVGLVALGVGALAPLVFFGEHYSSKWWKVTREKEPDTIPRRW